MRNSNSVTIKARKLAARGHEVEVGLGLIDLTKAKRRSGLTPRLLFGGLEA